MRWYIAVVFTMISAVTLRAEEPTGKGVGEEKQGAIAKQESGIAISVLDAATKQPIPKFRVLTGVRSGSTSPAQAAEIKQRTGHEVVTWQSNTIRVGQDGRYIWPWKRDDDELILRVEADGYQSQRSEWLRKSDQSKTLEFQLLVDPGIAGQVLQPDGQPAVGATVVLTMPGRSAALDNGHLRLADTPLPNNESDRWSRPILAKTDSQGRFQLSRESDPVAVILVLHDSGVRELSNDALQQRPEITLEPWGSIEGQVQWGDRPGANEKVDMGYSRDNYGYSEWVALHAQTRSDAQGRFVIDRVLPGGVQISRWIQLPAKEGDPTSAHSVCYEGMHVHAKVRSGEPTLVILGGHGRKVIGRLTGRDNWEGVTFHFAPTAPRPGDDEMWQGYGIYQSSEIAPLFFRRGLKPNADGTFEISQMLPGEYDFIVRSNGKHPGSTYRRIVIEPETPDKTPPNMDLGEIKLQPFKESAPAKAADKSNAVPTVDISNQKF